MEKAKPKYRNSCVLSKVLLQWLRRLPSVFHPLSLNISREVSLYLSVRCLIPAVKDSFLRVYDLEQRTVSEAKLERSFSRASVPCLIASDVVMYVGDFPDYSPKVFAVDLTTYKITSLPDMRVGRGWPGVILYEGDAYVFGGNSPQLASAEKFSISENQWHPIPDMNYARYSFTPALYKEEIYLADCMILSKVIEVFDPLKCLYRELPVRLPALGNHSVSFVIKNEFYFISYQFNLGKLLLSPLAEAFAVTSIIEESGSKAYSGCPPVIVGDYAYFANYVEGTLTQFDSREGTLKSYVDFSSIPDVNS